jgi:hypothetical protein
MDLFDAIPSYEPVEDIYGLQSGEDPKSDQDVLTLGPSALTALTSFLDDQNAAREAMVTLAVESHPQILAVLQLSVDDQTGDDVPASLPLAVIQSDFQTKSTIETLNTRKPKIQPQILDVDRFKGVFKSVLSEFIPMYPLPIDLCI